MHFVEYSTLKRKAILTCVITQKNLENMLNEIDQSPKNKYYVLFHLPVVPREVIATETESRMVATRS
jgi:hypothetical protein